MYTEFEIRLRQYIMESQSVIPSDEWAAVVHYLDHGEYEMAFEGLLIELIRARAYPPNFHYPNWHTLVVRYGLNVEAVFDQDIWGKLEKWAEACPFQAL